MDRMEAEVKSLQQQAQATQQSIKKLQARESVDPYNAIMSDLSGLTSINSALLGTASALLLAGVVVWWYVWHRPRTRWIDAPRRADLPEQAPVSVRAPLSERTPNLYSPGSTQPPSVAPQDDGLHGDPSTVSGGDTTQPYESAHSPFARYEPNVEFDPEAAASEVTRVRKSLANKREARAHLQDRDEAPAVELDLDLNEAPASNVASASDVALDLDLGPWQQPDTAPTDESPAATEEGISFTLAADGSDPEPESAGATEPEQQPEPEPPANHNDDAALDLDLALDAEPALVPAHEPEPELALALESEPEPALPPEPTPGPDMKIERRLTPRGTDSQGHDFTITLALAQESAALELWTEARDLASEVLESDNPELVSEALSLLERLNHMELNAPVDAPQWNGVR